MQLRDLPDSDRVDALVKSDSRIILAKSYAEILAAQAAGKVSMVGGWQDSAPLEEAAGNDWRGSTPPRTKLQYYYDRGLRTANLCYNLSNSFGGGCRRAADHETFRPYLEARDWVSINRGEVINFGAPGAPDE